MGFEKGWGSTVMRIRETMSLLLDILQAPDPEVLEDFLGRLPTMNKVVILSPHGFFGQKDVLGKPDTGGQVHPIHPVQGLTLRARGSNEPDSQWQRDLQG